MQTKYCYKCDTDKNEEEFSWKYKHRGIRTSECKECHRKYASEHYQKNRDIYIVRNLAHKRTIAEYVRQCKSVPCTDCNVQYPFYVMEFDHKGDKEFLLANATGRSLEHVKLEIAKCDVVCSNCHRQRSYDRGYTTPRSY